MQLAFLGESDPHFPWEKFPYIIYIVAIFRTAMTIKSWHGGRFIHGIYAHADDLDLDARSQWVGNGQNKSALNYLDN